jgi:hypothetical protein
MSATLSAPAQPWRAATLPFDDWWCAHSLVADLVPPGSRVLDIGCGFGGIAELCRSKGR